MSAQAVASKEWYMYVFWIAGAAALGFVIPALFSGVLRLERSVFLVPYALVAGAFVLAFFQWNHTDWVALFKQNWLYGLVGALLVGFFLVNNVRSQPASSASAGAQLVLDLLWLGVVYGALDALLLSVLPVVATWQAFSAVSLTSSWIGKIGVGAVALAASLVVTVCYHLGYPEYRNAAIVAPAIGNGIMSLGYLVTTNPLAAVLSHVAMHIAGVIQGPGTVVQLPPHY